MAHVEHECKIDVETPAPSLSNSDLLGKKIFSELQYTPHKPTSQALLI